MLYRQIIIVHAFANEDYFHTEICAFGFEKISNSSQKLDNNNLFQYHHQTFRDFFLCVYLDLHCMRPSFLCLQEAFVNVSSTIWVEYIIEDLVLLANETFVKPGDVVLFNMTVSQLSRANTTISYDDGWYDEEFRYEMLQSKCKR